MDMPSHYTTPTLEPGWAHALGDEIASDRMATLMAFLAGEASSGKVVHPAPSRLFACLDRTPLASVRVVLLGQDPYHGPGQAHGLSFSVPPGVRQPPSLRNIMAELAADLGMPPTRDGCLERWADQGVLLLNSVLSVEDGLAGSHAGRGWEEFTDCVVRTVNDRPGSVAFVLWGAYAQRKAAFVDRERHLVVASAHPSPRSARRGFLGSRPFSRVNAFLRERGLREIDWRVGTT